ncbi:MAG: hypothetical protein ABI846_13030 [Rudaea sp.]
MIFGMTPFLFFHVLMSLIGILAGLVVLNGLFGSKRLPGWTLWFLVTTIATSATGFVLPADHLLPSHIVGIISLVVLTIALFALYSRKLSGAWRAIYVMTAVLALYLNVFVLVAQAFLKVPSLHALAPTGSEPPFAIAQGIVLVLFLIAGVVAVKSFRPRRIGI